jgi:hypothetical protein
LPMHTYRLAWTAILLMPLDASAQESYKVERLKQAPPSGFSAAVQKSLGAEGYGLMDATGKTVAEIWLRKAVPASAKPVGPKGAVLYPNLAEGELLGALRFVKEGHDYRDQSIPPGLYTMRYGLQPENGDHLGVSVYRDYALILPAGKDTGLAPPPEKALHTGSAESAGANHPAVFLLQAAPKDAKDAAIVRDESKNLWGVILNLGLSVKDDSAPVSMPVQLIIVGAAPT